MTVPEELDTSFDGPLFSQCVREGVIYVPGDHAFAAEPEPRTEKPHPPDLRSTGRARVDRRSTPAGGGSLRLS